MKAKIMLNYKNAREAETVARAVSPDNLKTPIGLTVKTMRRGTMVVTKIDWEGEPGTLLATVNDLLSCVQVAEKTVKTVESVHKRDKLP